MQGAVLDVKRTGDSQVDKDGTIWEKCVFTIELVDFSKRSRNEVIPIELKGKKVKLVRYCCFDWHYRVGAKKTLESDETEAVIGGEPTGTVYW